MDILVLNASIQYKRNWDEFTLEEYEQQMNCNVRASCLLMKKYASGMKEKGWGRIVALGSVNQYNQHPELSLYGATKAAQFKLVENFAPLLAPYGITVNAVGPTVTETPMMKDVIEQRGGEAYLKSLADAVPMRKTAAPEDCVGTALFLASPASDFMTGNILYPDGGLTCIG